MGYVGDRGQGSQYIENRNYSFKGWRSKEEGIRDED
jgi:hypothetical protein